MDHERRFLLLTIGDVDPSRYSAPTERDDVQGCEIWSEVRVLLEFVGPWHRVRDDSCRFVDQDAEFLGSFSVHDGNKSFEFRTCTRRVTIVLDEPDVPGRGMVQTQILSHQKCMNPLWKRNEVFIGKITHDSTAGPLSLTQCRLPSLCASSEPVEKYLT